MRIPSGQKVKDNSKICYLSVWASYLEKTHPESQVKTILAAMGTPTFRLPKEIPLAGVEYWKQWLNPDNDNHAIDYLDSQGDFDSRARIANFFDNWYKGSVKIEPDNIIFINGAASALYASFRLLNEKAPNNILVTTLPYYFGYPGLDGQNRIHPISLEGESGYRLSASALQKSLDDLEKAGKTKEIGAFLFCDPNNPLGYTLTDAEWKEIGLILKKYPQTLIILDEAYAELCLHGHRHVSFLMACPELKDRMMVIRTATKGLSAAGERMAAMLVFNQNIIDRLTQELDQVYIHPPLSSQIIYSKAITAVDDHYLQSVADFYKPKVDFVQHRLKEIGVAISNNNYNVEGGFYVLADLSEFIGTPSHPLVMQAFGDEKTTELIETDQDIVMHLIGHDSIVFAPFSYFGADPKRGIVRITASLESSVLAEMMNRLEARVKSIRKNKLTGKMT